MSSSASNNLAAFASASLTGQTLWQDMPKVNAELFALTYGALVTDILRDTTNGNNSSNRISAVNDQLEKIGISMGVRCVDEYLARLDATVPLHMPVAPSPANFTTGTTINNANGGTTAGATEDTTTNAGSNNNNNANTPFISPLPACQTLRDTAEAIAKIGFRMFLGVTCDVINVTSKSFSLVLYDNPLTTFVELPENLHDEDAAAVSDLQQQQQSSDGGGNHSKNSNKIKYSNVYCGILKGALEQVNLRVNTSFVRDVLLGDEVNEIRVDLLEVIQEGAGEDYKEE